MIYSIETFEEFKEFIKSKSLVIGGFWSKLDKEKYVVMELEFENNFNPIFIDINDFQFLMPPFALVYPYTELSVARILNDIRRGMITVSEFPSDVIQAHLPNIEKRNVVQIYPLFDLV